MPLLTHEETGTEAVARNHAVALAERPPVPDRPERRGDGPRRSVWSRIRRAVYVLLGLLILGPVLAFVVGWLIFPVPTSEQLAVDQVSQFTFADGSPLATVRPEGVNRRVVLLDEVPEPVRQAVLAAENRSFYSDPGFDITGIMRAVYNQLTGGVGGGSTITQQYVKVITGDDDFSLVRKYKEVVLAVKITREQTKDEILENYLNVIYMGRSSYGIQAASQSFFGKDVRDLTLSEGAMLAGMIQAPSRWDPANDMEGSQRRWTYVMDQMVDAQFITPAQRASEVFPTAWLPEAPEVEGIPADDRGHIYERARDEVIARGIVTEDEFNTEGLTVTTTVDPGRQREAVEAVTEQLEGEDPDLRSALVSIDPRSGAIQAYYGGSDGQGTDYAGQGLRPPGSSFKPFVLAAAMAADPDIGLGSTFDGSSGQTLAGTVVDNSEGFDCASCTVQTAMTRSINTIFYRLGLDAGPQNVIDTAHELGIPADLVTEARGGVALGDQDVHPLDMASAYATLAADGVYHEPYLVSRVTAADGRTLYDRAESAGEQRIDPQIARNVTEAMLDVADFARIGLSGGREVAGKTGTQQHPTQDRQNKDAWMVGYTPSLATAVWLGTDTSKPIQTAGGSPIYGRMIPGSIWRDFMNAALRGTPAERFSPFVPLGAPPYVEPTAAPDDDDASEDDGSQDGDNGGDGNGDGDNGGDNGDNADGNGNGNDGNNGRGNDGAPGDRFFFPDNSGGGNPDDGSDEGDDG
ncbi:transglycosylase/D,D-transpeptidase PonA1 [Pseudonocardia hydrocarbonoxydans]|uniref:Penicillin-binding protein 1A n=2 Tax=Pseudonocardia hydrocarbonoxydans TaxID=76726 RepID=A0A4Y3WT33_9PSEU|nr:transglycosylase domain-containing protein [Pseudonocardia hydrocarbonoxydans]GEC21461.1 penicillin-binding protein 1A [Pseudonocardia hydrocarbonoxydans]